MARANSPRPESHPPRCPKCNGAPIEMKYKISTEGEVLFPKEELLCACEECKYRWSGKVLRSIEESQHDAPRKFQETTSCSKCGTAAKHGVEHHPKDGACQGFPEGHGPGTEEHMHRACVACAYEWPETPLSWGR